MTELLIDVVKQLNNEAVILNNNSIIYKKFSLCFDGLKFITQPHEFESLHLLNLLKIYNELELITLFLETMISINIYNKCILCLNNIDDIGCLNTCLNCLERSLILVIDNTISNYYNENTIAFNLLMLSGFECLKDNKVNLILDDMPLEINKTDILNFNFNVIKNKNDYEIYNTIGFSTYYFMKYIIKKNVINLKLYMNYSEKSNNTQLLSVIHHNEIINKFKNSCPTLLYHGSSLSNWMNIFKKGLKNYSSTSLERNGRAYGNGVYLASTPMFASSYSRGLKTVIAVVKVLDDIEQYKKTNDIYVVPDDSKLLIQYVIITNNVSNLKDVHTFITDSSTNSINININFNVIQKKRITNEFKRISYDYEEIATGYYVIYHSLNCEVSIVLSNDYPLYPPFIWFSKRQFTHEKILSNGAIFIQELFVPKWISSTTITKLFDYINEIIITSTNTEEIFTNDYIDSLNEYNKKLKEINII
jgi:hypothetical protein